MCRRVASVVVTGRAPRGTPAACVGATLVLRWCSRVGVTLVVVSRRQYRCNRRYCGGAGVAATVGCIPAWVRQFRVGGVRYTPTSARPRLKNSGRTPSEVSRARGSLNSNEPRRISRRTAIMPSNSLARSLDRSRAPPNKNIKSKVMPTQCYCITEILTTRNKVYRWQGKYFPCRINISPTRPTGARNARTF